MHTFTYNEQARRTILPPEKILKQIGLIEGNTFIDIGCNDGYFAIPAAQIVGSTGKIYGVDIDNSAINRLLQKAQKQNLNNIQAKVGRAESTLYCTACADFVFFGTVLHDFLDPRQVLKNAYEALAPSGKLVNLDWKKKKGEMGPPFEKRFSEETASGLMSQAGFKNIEIEEFSPDFYLISAAK